MPRTTAMLNGAKWRHTHQRTVDSVLADTGETRKVYSRGTAFYNVDTWTARVFAAAMCEWARLNPDLTPNEHDVSTWVWKANREIHRDEWGKGITIAQTPDELPKGLALALVGGGYHEAWHTLYSRRTMIRMSEVWPKVRDLWALVPYAPAEGKKGWAGLTKMLLDWGNIIEDIRIERVGCREFPGAPRKMEALQDLILKQEEEGRSVSEHRGIQINHDLSVVTGTFRDVGLGYRTPTQDRVLRDYRKRSLLGWDFVTKGPLKPLLDRAIALGPQDDLDHLWLAMEVVGAIVAATAEPPKPEPEEEPEGQEEGEEESGAGEPPPPQQMPDQLEAEWFQDQEEPEEEAPKAPPQPVPNKPLLYKVGDRAVLNTGEHKGRTVEVVRASLPHPETGVQRLEFALVEDD
jgi:hypothetical protein